jgi:hypothetical protein
MTRPTRVEVNCTTGETSIIELTDEEVAELEAAQAQAELDRAAKKLEDQAKAEAKAALLEKLGITSEEAALLLS